MSTTRKQAIFDLRNWQESSQDYYTIRLYKLMNKADRMNYEKLKLVYPIEAQAYEMWQSSVDPDVFFAEHLGDMQRR